MWRNGSSPARAACRSISATAIGPASTRYPASFVRVTGRARRATVPSPSKQRVGALGRMPRHDAMPTPSMAQFTIAASEGPARARDVFQHEGIAVLKQALPAAVWRATYDFLAAALAGMPDMFARSAISIDARDCGKDVARLLG